MFISSKSPTKGSDADRLYVFRSMKSSFAYEGFDQSLELIEGLGKNIIRYDGHFLGHSRVQQIAGILLKLISYSLAIPRT